MQEKLENIITFRLDDLKKNLESWEGYENFRNKFDGQVNEAEVEFKSTVRIYNLEEGTKNHTERLATASKMRKLIEETMGKYKGANDELAKMLPDDTKDEMQEEVRKFFQHFALSIWKKKVVKTKNEIENA